MKLEKLAQHYRIDKPRKFKLSDHDPADCFGLSIDKSDAKDLLEEGVKRLSDLQERLYADDRWSVLVVLQAMDAAGKDSVIEHVMTGVNPQGLDVHPFKQPSHEELDHDFLWRAAKVLPPRGKIAIFNRSYYEEVLVVRVHPELIANERLPTDMTGKHLWKTRFRQIRDFERRLAETDTLVLKFFLNVSKDEQRKRFLDRIDQPAKRWKFSMGDVAERKLWDKYMEAYADMVEHTGTDEAPWFVVPADNKWFTRLVVAAALVDALDGLKLEFPKVEGKVLKELEQVRKALKAEK